jgi:6-phosphogluconolactonase
MIRVCADQEALSRAAAGIFAEEARRAAQSRGRFTVTLAGGETPRRTYEILAQSPFRESVPWQGTHVFWGDERCVAAEDPRNNARLARRALLDHVPIPPAQVHPMVCDYSPREAAEGYEALLRGFFAADLPRFDLVLLGLGDDGHTASLFPGSSALEEQQRWVVEVHASGEGMDRLTLTVPVINQAALVVFLVTGSGKAPILRQVLEDAPELSSIPARLIGPADGKLLWLVDRDAASLLKKRTLNG